MSVFKTTFSKSLKVIPSYDAVIPSPYLLKSGTTDSDPANNNLLVDYTANFISLDVKVGDVVYCYEETLASTIISVTENILTLSTDTFFDVSREYFIYQQSAASGLGNQGCCLYVDSYAKYLSVITIGGDDVIFNGVKAGTVLPVQVIQLGDSSGSNDIIALW